MNSAGWSLCKRAAAALVGALPLLCAAPGWSQVAADPHDLSGVWWVGTKAQPLVLVGGGKPVFTAAGVARFTETAARTRAIAADKNLDDVKRCVAFGSPRIWLQPFPVKIVQANNQVALIYEHNHVWRLVQMDEPQAADPDPSFMGHGVARWDGDTLVIDSIAIKDTVLDDSGLPHSDKLHLTERLHKIDGGKSLEVLTTVDDPTYYAKPWTARVVLHNRPDVQIEEYVCGYGALSNRYVSAAK